VAKEKLETGTGKTLYREQFETEGRRKAKEKEIRKRYPKADISFELIKEDSATDSNVIKNALKEMDNIIDRSELTGKQSAKRLRDELKTQLRDALLSTLPASSLQKRRMKSENIPGMSRDVLRIHDAMLTSYANQIPKLQYAGKIRNDVRNAREVLKTITDPRAAERLGFITDEMERRFEKSLNPPGRGKVATIATHLTYLWLLTGAASAAVQLSAIPIRTFPALMARFGHAKAAATIGKYSKVIPSTLNPRNFKRSGRWILWERPTMEGSNLLSTPVLNKAFHDFLRRGVYNEILTSVVGGPSVSPTVTGGLRKPLSKVATVMGALFGAMETLSRQITAMSFFELNYEANIEKGMKQQEAYDAAITETLERTNDALGDYSDVERGTYTGNEDVDQIVFQFKQFSVNTTRFFLQTGGKAIGMDNTLTKKEKAQAQHELAGVLLMGGLFHGLRGTPAYGVISGTVALLLAGLEDEDDEALRMAETPYTFDNPDMRLKKFLEDNFGDVKLPSASKITGGVSLADAIMYGPLSATSGVDVGSRTALDQMWWRSPGPSANWKEWGANLAKANLGPSISTGENILSGFDDIADGRLLRGLEQVLPAFFKGPVKTIRLGMEGEVNRSGENVIQRTELTDVELAGAFLGFSPTQINKVSRNTYSLRNAQAAQKNMRSNLVNRYYRAITSPNGATSSQLENIGNDINEYNRRYSDPNTQLNSKMLADELVARMQESRLMFRGLPLTTENYLQLLSAMGVDS